MVEYLVLVYKGAVGSVRDFFFSLDTMTWWLYILLGAAIVYVLVRRVR